MEILEESSDLIIDPPSVISIREAVVGFTVAVPGVLDGHGRIGGDAAGDPGRGADDRVVADDGLAAEDGRVGVDDDVILDGRMPLGVADDLAGLVAGKLRAPRVTPW